MIYSVVVYCPKCKDPMEKVTVDLDIATNVLLIGGHCTNCDLSFTKIAYKLTRTNLPGEGR